MLLSDSNFLTCSCQVVSQSLWQLTASSSWLICSILFSYYLRVAPAYIMWIYQIINRTEQINIISVPPIPIIGPLIPLTFMSQLNIIQNIEYDKMIFQKLGIKPKVLKALLGAVILKFSTSITTCWGNINLYFLSLFHYQGTKITSETNSQILVISVLPMVISLLIATRLCNRFGYQFIIRICAVVFAISPLVSLISFNIYTFVVFSIIIPGSMFALGSVPILNCMWTQFPKSKNKVTAILVIMFGVGGILWNLIFMHMINPTNQSATIKEEEDINFFSQAVTQNVKKTAITGFAITGALSILGSFLIERKAETEEQLKQDQQVEGDQKVMSNQDIKITEENALTFKQSLKDQKFILIMMISLLTGLYQIHLIMNFKIIFMPIVGDDHFLGYSMMLCSFVSIAGAFIWGYLGDLKGAAYTILILSILDFGGKIYSDFALSKPMIIGMVILIGLISKSMTTIAGPAFVEYYGIKMGTQLLPFKGVAILVGYLMVPFFQIMTSDYLTPHQYLVVLSFASLITLACAIKLYIVTCKNNRQVKLEVQPCKLESAQSA